jgi:hypothetical protein
MSHGDVPHVLFDTSKNGIYNKNSVKSGKAYNKEKPKKTAVNKSC